MGGRTEAEDGVSFWGFRQPEIFISMCHYEDRAVITKFDEVKL